METTFSPKIHFSSFTNTIDTFDKIYQCQGLISLCAKLLPASCEINNTRDKCPEKNSPGMLCWSLVVV